MNNYVFMLSACYSAFPGGLTPSSNQKLVDTTPDLDASDKIRRQLAGFDGVMASVVWRTLCTGEHVLWSCTARRL